MIMFSKTMESYTQLSRDFSYSNENRCFLTHLIMSFSKDSRCNGSKHHLAEMSWRAATVKQSQL